MSDTMTWRLEMARVDEVRMRRTREAEFTRTRVNRDDVDAARRRAADAAWEYDQAVKLADNYTRVPKWLRVQVDATRDRMLAAMAAVEEVA